MFSFLGGGILTYNFIGIFTQDKRKKIIITVIIAIIIAVVIWSNNQSSVVNMKEDVLYVHPKK